ncbi:hypothetical protein DPMN_101080 [Dreissena polymorpha]|uniref:Leucine--tRNA ligase ubiquitin-like domain-containing protein n=1 Tax=Dreissena polymorpha TaxID=45954 RepID=A0A9D4LGV2_DREPO|nr:hypothetical protein DPMN_101080 [Dreissena polymorpha]
MVRFINPQPSSGAFEVKLPIFQGDTLEQLKSRLQKTGRGKMKGKVTIWHCKLSS